MGKRRSAGRAPGDVERKTEEKEKEKRRERGAPFSLIPLPVSFISLYTATTMNKACLSSKKCVASTSRLVAATQNKVSRVSRSRFSSSRMIRADWLSEHLNSGGFIGSPTNVAVCTATATMLFAVRYGYAPGTARNAKLEKGLNLVDSGSDMLTGDPMGMTFVDVLAAGSFGHVIAAGMILGLKNMGQL